MKVCLAVVCMEARVSYIWSQIKINTITSYIITILVCLYLLQMEGITSSEQPKITSPNDAKAILKHVSCYSKNCLL